MITAGRARRWFDIAAIWIGARVLARVLPPVVSFTAVTLNYREIFLSRRVIHTVSWRICITANFLCFCEWNHVE